MIDYENIFNIHPFSMTCSEKHDFMLTNMLLLSKMHYSNCFSYKKIIDTIGIDLDSIDNLSDIPYIPARLFKKYHLSSISDDSKYRIINSSSTSGGNPSKIILDKYCSINCQRTLSLIVRNFIGDKRLPMVIIDNRNILFNKSLVARAAGILGFSIFGRDILYALDDNMNVKIDELLQFIEKYRNERILFFGFTFIIWQYFYNVFLKSKYTLDLSNSVLIHGGGWKKLLDMAIPKDEFKYRLEDLFSIKFIYDYYGMAEQTGSIFMECEFSYLHASIFSDIFIRKTSDFSVCNIGEPGIVQVLSLLPTSYPGHSLLSEDYGVLIGEDDCKCGRFGKYFNIIGRIKDAEIRGCSNV